MANKVWYKLIFAIPSWELVNNLAQIKINGSSQDLLIDTHHHIVRIKTVLINPAPPLDGIVSFLTWLIDRNFK